MSFINLLRRQPVPLRLRCACRPYSDAASSSNPPKTAKAAKKSDASASMPVSSCPADTILPGVNYLKGQAPVVALPDDQYPEWLWDVLQPRVYEDDGPGGKKERMERRKINQQAIKDRNFMQTQ